VQQQQSVRDGSRKNHWNRSAALLVRQRDNGRRPASRHPRGQSGHGLHLQRVRQSKSNIPTHLNGRKSMPTYNIQMMEGRTLAQKKKLVEEITRVTVEVLGSQPESVDIIITDVKRENWATGGKLWSEPRE
jgi:4-oxalocrotonate tautomerase